MKPCPEVHHLLVLPHLQVQNANAISSPLTHGFPSMTAFLGLMWALERKARQQGSDVHFSAVGVVCHRHDEQTHRGGYIQSFRLTRNPIKKDGKTAAIVEEGRIHLDLTLLLAVDSPRWQREPHAAEQDAAQLAEWLQTLRVAGGSLMPQQPAGHPRFKPRIIDCANGTENFLKARRWLLPGFTLVACDEALTARHRALQEQQPDATRLDAWLSLARINWHYHEDERGKGIWDHDRHGLGWLVPIPVGYGALGPVHAPGSIANTRDTHTPFRFVESLYSIGQWISPHRIEDPRQMLWFADSQPEQGLYRCRNHFHLQDAPQPTASFEPDYFAFD